MPVKNEQLKLNLEVPRRFGGRQPGAGRPRGPRPKALHRARKPFRKDHPLHVTFRVRSDVPMLRQPRFIRAFRRTLREGCDRDGFRVIHYSVQRDHVHCVVEAINKQALGSGMKSLGARFARARKHFKQRIGYALPVQLDQASSGVWFQGWKFPALCKPPGLRERDGAAADLVDDVRVAQASADSSGGGAGVALAGRCNGHSVGGAARGGSSAEDFVLQHRAELFIEKRVTWVRGVSS